MRRFTFAFLGFSLLSSLAMADLNLPAKAVDIRVDNIYTKGGNIAENLVRGALAKALTSHVLNRLTIVSFGIEIGDRGLVFETEITENQLSQVVDSITASVHGASEGHISITYP